MFVMVQYCVIITHTVVCADPLSTLKITNMAEVRNSVVSCSLHIYIALLEFICLLKACTNACLLSVKLMT
jgi:hypothetical protein